MEGLEEQSHFTWDEVQHEWREQTESWSHDDETPLDSTREPEDEEKKKERFSPIAQFDSIQKLSDVFVLVAIEFGASIPCVSSFETQRRIIEEQVSEYLSVADHRAKGHVELAARALYRQLLFSMDLFCTSQNITSEVLLQKIWAKAPENLASDFPKLEQDSRPYDPLEVAASERYGPVPEPLSIRRRVVEHFKTRWKTYFPPLIWVPSYRITQQLLPDVIAGLTIGAFLVPQGMAYAQLAGLPVQIGLYSSTIPVFVYALFGTSRQMAIGPFALVALLVASALSSVIPAGLPVEQTTALRVQASVNLMMYVGMFLTIFGILRMGFISNFISRSFLAGFTSASGLSIQMTQLPGLAGIKVPSTYQSMSFIDQLTNVVRYLPTLSWPTLIVGLATLAIVITIETLNVRKPIRIKSFTIPIPSALIVIILSIGLSYGLNFSGWGIKIVGFIPAGFNQISLPSFDQFGEQFVNALIIALIVYLSSAAIAIRYAEIHGYETDGNQEMIALGLMNVIGSFFSGFVGCGAMSRSAVANSAGARSPVFGVITGLVVLLILFVATGIMYYLPSACLSAMIFVAAYGLWDFLVLLRLWRIRKLDFLVWWVSFLVTLFLNASIGLLIALAFSIIVVVYQASQPHIALLGRLPRTMVWRNVRRFPEALVLKGLVVLRIDADFFFANIRYIHSAILRIVQEEKSPVHVLILDLSAVTDFDYTAVSDFQKTMEWLRKRDIVVMATAVNGPVRDRFRKSRFISLIGEQNVYWLHSDAVAAARAIIRTKEKQDEDELVPQSSESIGLLGGPERSFATRERLRPQQSFWQKLI